MAADQGTADPYPLGRNWLSSLRLNYQHFFIKSATGFLLHPSIQTGNNGVRIADIGTGTGIWASELSLQLPASSRIDALDVSGDQYPPEAWRVPNVHYGVHNCFEPFPEEYLGKFDIVHVRFFMCVVSDDQANDVIRNLMTLLKPGGYLQWLEPSPETSYVSARNGGKPTPFCEKLLKHWAGGGRTGQIRIKWIDQLAKLFGEQGLEVVADSKYEIPDCYRQMWAQGSLLGYEEFARVDPVDSPRRQFMNGLAHEFAEGALIDFQFTCVVSRKPAN